MRLSDDETPTEPLNLCIADELAALRLTHPAHSTTWGRAEPSQAEPSRAELLLSKSAGCVRPRPACTHMGSHVHADPADVSGGIPLAHPKHASEEDIKRTRLSLLSFFHPYFLSSAAPFIAVTSRARRADGPVMVDAEAALGVGEIFSFRLSFTGGSRQRTETSRH